MPHFQYIELLFLLFLIPLLAALFYFSLKKKKAVAQKIGDPALVKQLTAGYQPRAYLIKFLLITFSLGLLVIVLANLRKAAGEQKVSRDGIDVMIALDVSKSMLA